MWHPNRQQWWVIWIATAVVLIAWWVSLDRATRAKTISYDVVQAEEIQQRVVGSVLVVAVLMVWSLSKKRPLML
jgi:hypothetical protein